MDTELGETLGYSLKAEIRLDSSTQTRKSKANGGWCKQASAQKGPRDLSYIPLTLTVYRSETCTAER